MSMPNSSGGVSDPSAFIPNGVLRAHVVKAECCLLMGILQMTQESVVGYLKCGLNIRRGMKFLQCCYPTIVAKFVYYSLQ